MNHIFDFGISQEDAGTEYRALDISNGDRLLCISSAGEIPLNMLALNDDIKIKAVDISINQNHLSRLKLHAVRALEPEAAAKFLGFTKAAPEHLKQLYKRVSGFMNEEEKLFWDHNQALIEAGPIHAARYERYIRKFNGIARWIIGKKNLFTLFDADSTEAQRSFFDRKINSFLLKKIFRIAFHPRIYKNRGIASEGLSYSEHRDIAEFFFNRFRDFCCSTPARENYYLQFTFFNQVLFPEALPEYLTHKGAERIRRNFKNLEISNMSYKAALQECKKGAFNKYHLSNIGDWMDKTEFAVLLRLINEKTGLTGKICSRYIYYNHPIPMDLKNCFFADEQFGEQLMEKDRYPFYVLVPVAIDKGAS